ncbi:MAG: MFS transporter [Phycisphaeraceae bacterium]|nr:MFS transporter [Phycisphaeraceae bacterium]
MSDPTHDAHATAIHRFLGARAGELAPALWSCAYFFFVLCSYSLLRPLRESEGIRGGVERLPLLFILTMGAMLLVNPLFGVLVSSMPRRRFIPLTYRFFILNLLVLAGLFGWRGAHPDAPGGHLIGHAFYIWLSVFNLFAVSVFWAFMVDVWQTRQSRRLFGFIGVGGTVGAIAGAGAVSLAARGVPPWGFLLASAALLECACWCVRRLGSMAGLATAPARASASIHAGPEPTLGTTPGGGALAGIRMLARSPYLLGIGAYVLIFTTLATMLYFIQAKLVFSNFDSDRRRTEFFANLDFVSQSITLMIQLFLTGRLIRWIGVGWTLAAQPLLMLVGFVVLGLVMSRPEGGTLTSVAALWTFAVFQVLRRGFNYALAKPAREILFTRVSQAEKYGSKPIIDTFVYRTGDVVGALGFEAMTSGVTAPIKLAGLALPLAAISFWMAPVAGLWLVIALALGAANTRRTDERAPREAAAGADRLDDR